MKIAYFVVGRRQSKVLPWLCFAVSSILGAHIIAKEGVGVCLVVRCAVTENGGVWGSFWIESSKEVPCEQRTEALVTDGLQLQNNTLVLIDPYGETELCG